MSETQPETNPFASVTWPESYPDATQSADNGAPAVTTITEPTPPENAASGAKRAREALNQWAQEYGETARKTETEGAVTLNDVMRACNTADSIARATGTEAHVCADIAERQRRGIAKYGTTVADNPLPIVGWLQHAYEEVLDLAIYLKRTIDEINENPNHISSGAGVAGALAGKLRRPRAPGSGRKPTPCPNCGAEKSIGMTTLNKIPTRRCKACLHVIKQYPNLAKQAAT